MYRRQLRHDGDRVIVPTILQQWWLRSAAAPPQEKAGFIMEPSGEVPMRVVRG